ncbi:MAG TPA: molybdopterin-dependent oxidoreductase [Nannocystaceae bacterium]|nr:molybdopterin-dependent oxidoreductase [Nannocystaceae bacterium]
MSDSQTPQGALVATRSALATTAPDELELRPIEGMARWLGRLLHPIAFRMVSMIEQRPATMVGPLTPIDGYFRRDRHRHPKIDASTWRVRVTGVRNPRELTLDDLRALEREERLCVMECAGNGNHLMGSAGLLGQARWAGPSLATVLSACGGPGDATHFAFHGLDPIPVIRKGYHYGLSLAELARAKALLAITMNGEPLPRERGFPCRLIVPGIYSMSHVKWLGHIEGKTQPHMGIHNRWVFTNKERTPDGWKRVQARWIGLKSMVTRCQRMQGGWLLSGWAWGGGATIAGVDVTTDGGATWKAAEVRRPESYFPDQPLAPEATEHAWSTWSYFWDAPNAGEYRIASRARASDGRLQDLEQDPNVEGHFNQTRVKWRAVTVP